MTKALLLRNHYPFHKQQIWMPMDLYKVAVRLEAIGIETDVLDMNIDSLPENLNEYDYVGIGVIGAPNIPESQRLAREIKEKTGKPALLGGQTIEKITAEEFNKIFDGAGIQIRNDADLLAAVGKSVPLQPVSEASIAKQMNGLSHQKARQYLQNEFSFYMSQGCKFNCDFCAAAKNMPEKYTKTAEEDLAAICERADALKTSKVEMYLSSLDMFQNPKEFINFLRTFANARKKYNVDISIRGLSRVDSFLKAMEKDPELYELIPAAGLVTVGFGIDGVTEEVWKSQHKANKSLLESDQAFKICRRVNVIPEALLVLGFHENNGYSGDTPESLKFTAEYAEYIATRFGTVARPYVAKDFAPGNHGWKDARYAARRKHVLEHIHLFKNLDYAALASEVTHPDPAFRAYVNESFMKIIDRLRPQGLCVTSPVMPYRDGTGMFDKEWNDGADTFNSQVPFDH